MSKRATGRNAKNKLFSLFGHRLTAEKSDDDKRLRPIHPLDGTEGVRQHRDDRRGRLQ